MPATEKPETVTNVAGIFVCLFVPNRRKIFHIRSLHPLLHPVLMPIFGDSRPNLLRNIFRFQPNDFSFG